MFRDLWFFFSLSSHALVFCCCSFIFVKRCLLCQTDKWKQFNTECFSYYDSLFHQNPYLISHLKAQPNTQNIHIHYLHTYANSKELYKWLMDFSGRLKMLFQSSPLRRATDRLQVTCHMLTFHGLTTVTWKE